MIEPFIWMFKAKNFVKRFLQLLVSVFIFLFLAMFLCCIGTSVPVIYQKWLYLLAAVLPVLLMFLVQGYFWELTAKIISRDEDIVAANVYSGKIKSIFIIELPDFKPLVFLWRGFASLIASILMFVPFVLLVTSSLYTQFFFMPYDNIAFYHRIYAISYNVIYFLFFALIPAMLWNYAKQNSIVAVWNFPKAFYLLENYPFKYIFNTVLFILFYLFNYFILSLLMVLYSINIKSFLVFSYVSSFMSCLPFFIFVLFVYIIYLYSLHVYAYLLGTIAPVSEV